MKLLENPKTNPKSSPHMIFRILRGVKSLKNETTRNNKNNIKKRKIKCNSFKY